jgi:hypothetical protein
VKAPITEALDSTWAALNARMRNIRGAAFAAAGIILAVPALALALRAPSALSGFAALPLLGYAFARRDRRLVSAWEDRILALWAGGSMPMGVLVTTLSLQPGPLKASLLEMLALLPAHGENLGPAPAEAGLRRALSVTRQLLEEIRWTRSAARVLMAAALASSLYLALARSQATGAAAALGLCAAIAGGQAAWMGATGRTWRRRLARIESETPWEPARLAEEIRGAQWRGLPSRYRAHLAPSGT